MIYTIQYKWVHFLLTVIYILVTLMVTQNFIILMYYCLLNICYTLLT